MNLNIIITYDNNKKLAGCSVGEVQVKEYVTDRGVCPFREWLESLNITTKARIQAPILRFESGNLGDYQPVGSGVFEARLDFGPGYRIYFGVVTNNVLILLIGGDKRRQSKDIAKAKEYWSDWKEENHHDKKKS